MTEQLARWVELLRQMARNAEVVAKHMTLDEPDVRDGWLANARDLREIADHLEKTPTAAGR